MARQEGIENGMYNVKKIASEISWNYSTVSRWANGILLPRLDQAYDLAKALNTGIDQLLLPFDSDSIYNMPTTYGQAFLVIRHFANFGILNAESIKDPILEYLLKEGNRIDNIETLDETKKENWYRQAYQDFDMPLLQSSDFTYFNECFDACQEISEYESYLATAKMLRALASPYYGDSRKNNGFSNSETVSDEDISGLYDYDDSFYSSDHVFDVDLDGDFDIYQWIREYQSANKS